MAPPLRRRKRDGTPYGRPPAVEAAIDALGALDAGALAARAKVVDHASTGYMPTEVLLHVIRATRLDNSPDRFRLLFVALLDRVERLVLAGIPASRLFDAAEVRQQVMDRFVDLLVADRETPDDKLDFFECRFNMALEALRIGAVRRVAGKAALTQSLSEPGHDNGEVSPEIERAFAEQFGSSLTDPETGVFRSQLAKAINELPDNQRHAVTLMLEGYQAEAKEGAEMTIAKLCGVGDRAIRYRLTKAYAALSRKLGGTA